MSRLPAAYAVHGLWPHFASLREQDIFTYEIMEIVRPAALRMGLPIESGDLALPMAAPHADLFADI